MHFHNTEQEPLPRGHRIYNFGIGIPFLGDQYYILSLSDPCPGVEKKDLMKYIIFTSHSLLNYFSSGKEGEGSCFLEVIVYLFYNYYIPNLVKMGTVILEKKI